MGKDEKKNYGKDETSKPRVVLVGTYKGNQLAKWRGWYCYPIPNNDEILSADVAKINELWLFKGMVAQKTYNAEFVGIKTRTELINSYGYPARGKAHGDKYLLFRTTFKYLFNENLTNEAEKVIIRTADFTTSPVVRKQLKAYLESTDRNNPALAQLLPSIVLSMPSNRLCVCDSSLQLTIWDLPGMEKEGSEVPFPPPEHPKFTFIDLFAGIGGIRLGFQAVGGKCIYSSEFDGPAQKTYEANFGEVPYGDITKQETKDAIPDGIDIVCAGFPCQAFSLAGKRMGFDDNYKGMCRGTLFKEVVEICEKHQPKVVFCENVKGLLIHDKGRTLKVIQGAFEEIGYRFYYTVLNSKDFGVPQYRERLYMVAIRKDIVESISCGDANWSFPFPKPSSNNVSLQSIRETNVPARYYLSTVYIETLKRHKARHEALGHGFGYEIRKWDGLAGAIVCGGMGRERNLVIDKTNRVLVPETHIKGTINTEGIRKMTPREWARLQGFPEEFRLVLSDVHLYKQLGNSVSVPVIKAISQRIVDIMVKFVEK
ncbi:MAG: DNA cytosine methyltransferase [Victivallales bacterium]|nr:DNA cytosine methyltransferase [Victivallales bacterium]